MVSDLVFQLTNSMQVFCETLTDERCNDIISCVACGNSSAGRAMAFQAVGRGFESRFPLQKIKGFTHLREPFFADRQQIFSVVVIADGFEHSSV